MRRQHHKGRKRPRAWHRSLSSTRQYWRSVRAMNTMFDRAEKIEGGA